MYLSALRDKIRIDVAFPEDGMLGSFYRLYPFLLFLSILYIGTLNFAQADASNWNTASLNLLQTEIIQNGFQFESFAHLFSPLYGSATAPMWGYAWLFLITENFFFWFLMQAVLMTIAVTVLFSVIKRRTLLPAYWLLALKIIMLFPSWHAIHGIVGPKSPAISMLLLGLALVLDPLLFSNQINRSELKRLIGGGLAIGFSLNFRTDMMVVLLIILLLVMLFFKRDRIFLKQAALVVVTIMITMLPWIFYTKHVTGHYLLHPTQAGMSFIQGLALEKNNVWGVKFDDHDPKLLEAARRVKPELDMIDLSYETDKAMMDMFISMVKAHPEEYMRKIYLAIMKTYNNGVYLGIYERYPFYSVINKEHYEIARRKYSEYGKISIFFNDRSWEEIWDKIKHKEGQILETEALKRELNKLTNGNAGQVRTLLRYFGHGVWTWVKEFASGNISIEGLSAFSKTLFLQLRLYDAIVTFLAGFVFLLLPFAGIYYTFVKKSPFLVIMILLICAQFSANALIVYSPRHTAHVYPYICVLSLFFAREIVHLLKKVTFRG
ncbi:hypothetical protein ACQZV8_15685 [Magnetococcales bacterium HHB-1]